MTRLPGWTYDHSDALGMDYALHEVPEGIDLYTEDKVHYTPPEVEILMRTVGEITKGIHAVKKIFSGVIIEPTRRGLHG